MNIRQLAGVLATALSFNAAFYATLSAQVTRDLQVVTLDDARTRALAVAPASAAARGATDVAAWSRRSALTDLITPHVTAGTTYATYKEPSFNPGTGSISAQATSATVQASYTIFGGGKFAAVKRARADVERAAATETASEFRVALSQPPVLRRVGSNHVSGR